MRIKEREKAVPANLDQLLTLEEPGHPYLFDMDREMIEDVPAGFSYDLFLVEIAGKNQEELEKLFTRSGNELMDSVYRAADKYKDRTAEMIELVARQTGIGFPHPLQRLIELSFLSSRRNDSLKIVESTTKKLRIQVVRCHIFEKVRENEIGLERKLCSLFCLSCFQRATQKLGNEIKIEHIKSLASDGLCEFLFTPSIPGRQQ